MKKLDIKIKPETMVSAGLAVLGVAQMLLTNKKESSSRRSMKAEILKELKDEMLSKDN